MMCGEAEVAPIVLGMLEYEDTLAVGTEVSGLEGSNHAEEEEVEAWAEFPKGESCGISETRGASVYAGSGGSTRCILSMPS